MRWRDRTDDFCRRFGLHVPILLAPMAGVAAPALSVAVARSGGMGACGVLMMSPSDIAAWCGAVRAATDGAFQLNLWVPDPAPVRDPGHEARVAAFLAGWGPAPSASAADARPPDFTLQWRAVLEAAPAVVSSVMGLFDPDQAQALRSRGLAWFATVSTLAEARQAQAAGADAIVVQGCEAGGHRAAFDARRAQDELVGLFSLLPAVVDAVDVPVVAAGGIADGRGIAAALLLGASAVQIGTAFLRCPEAAIPPAWAQALSHAAPEDTRISAVFSGRPARSLATAYVRAATAPDAPRPAPYPVQRGLTAAMRATATAQDDLARMQAWAGQSAALSRAAPAAELVSEMWEAAQTLLA
jgi:nitronate monooxygenase